MNGFEFYSGAVTRNFRLTGSVCSLTRELPDVSEDSLFITGMILPLFHLDLNKFFCLVMTGENRFISHRHILGGGEESDKI